METDPSRARPVGRLVLLGAAVAMAAGLALAMLVLVLGRPGQGPPPASEGGLVVEAGRRGDPGPPSPLRLRCFVQGRLVGELPLEDCAQRNGIASGTLEANTDPSGEPRVGSGDLANLSQPPPALPVEVIKPPEPQGAGGGTPAGGLASCWRHNGTDWRRLPGEMAQSACVQLLFAGRCERPGEASYGRWGAQTLRLVTGRVEISADNRTFRLLVEQDPNCGLPQT